MVEDLGIPMHEFIHAALINGVLFLDPCKLDYLT